jgi:hypothetical protein
MPSHAATHHLTAATDSHASSHVDNSLAGLAALAPTAAVLAVVVLAVYLLWCWISPFTRCPHHNRRDAFHCRRCDGTEIRLRAGRRLLNELRDFTGRHYHR